MFVTAGAGTRAERYEEVRWLGKLARQRGRLRMHQRAKLTDRARELEEAVGEQAMLALALLRLLFENGTLPRPEFLKVLRETDLEDGQTDGKRARTSGSGAAKAETPRGKAKKAPRRRKGG